MSVREPEIGIDVTLAHDYLLVMRGAERTFAAIAELYSPRAPIFTLLYDEAGTDGRFAGHSVTTSPLNRLGVGQRQFRRLLPLYPWAIRQLALPPSDVVLSSSSAFAHAVRVPPGALHVCYCHAPFRYAWTERERALQELPAPLRPLLRRQLDWMRGWDRSASRGVDLYLANSQLTRERIKRFYGRESTVIHPPVETHRFSPGAPGEKLLLVTELVPHKRVEVALEAARRVGVPVEVVGAGPAYASLHEAYPEVSFLGRVDDAELARLYAAARAVVITSVEEFGITAVEAQAAGRPVLAARAGGVLETVIDGETGLLAEPGDVSAFAAAIEALDRLDFDPRRAVANADRFSVANFQARLSSFVTTAIEDGDHGPRGPVLSGRERPTASASSEA
ncbi:MAG TPA: glycosyltransferase [Solirubrobacteraceae bacterium]|nr:glycosyltransferase [Solirubrobacteraceae bacterium]